MSRTVMFASDTACFSTILSVTSLIGIFNTLRNLPLQQKKNRDIIFRWLVRPQVSILSTKFIFQSQPMFPFSKDWCDFNVNLVWYITCKNYLIGPFKLYFLFYSIMSSIWKKDSLIFAFCWELVSPITSKTQCSLIIKENNRGSAEQSI